MTREDIIRMAKECGNWSGQTVEMNDVGLERFAKLIRAAIEQSTWVKSYAGGKPNYTTPEEQTRQWQGLTDEEIDTLYEAHHDQYGECKVVGYGYERAIEAKLKEKNK